MRTQAFALILAIIAIGCGTPAPAPEATDEGVTLDLPTDFEQASQTILAENLLADVSIIAGDEFEQRGLSHPVWPHDRGDHTGRGFKREFVDGGGAVWIMEADGVDIDTHSAVSLPAEAARRSVFLEWFHNLLDKP